MMFIRRFDHPTAFLQHAGDFLTRQEAANNLLLGLAGNLQRGMSYGSAAPYLAVVLDQYSAVVAAALHTPPHNFILAQTTREGAVRTLAEDAYRHYPTLRGVLGTSPNSRTFVERWVQLSGQSYRTGLLQRSYVLTSVIPVHNVAGALDRATLADSDLLTDWLVAFQREALDEPDPQRIRDSLPARMNPEVGGFYFWQVDGQPVSLVGYTGFTPNGVRIGPVYTPPELRGRGYASACTAAVSQLLLDSGRRMCFLFTDLANPTANHIYRTIGYQPVVDVDEYVFEG